jgi:hypothetical protein
VATTSFFVKLEYDFSFEAEQAMSGKFVYVWVIMDTDIGIALSRRHLCEMGCSANSGP